MTKITQFPRKRSALLLVGVSGLAMAMPAQANEYLFTTNSGAFVTGQRVTQTEELTQISLTGGGTASFTDGAEYQINADGSIDLYRGSVTIAGTDDRAVVLRMPEGLDAQVAGRGSSANFSVNDGGQATGHVLTGDAKIGRRGRLRGFEAGAMWSAVRGGTPRRVIANAAQTAPEAKFNQAAQPIEEPRVEALGGDAGPVAAARNGIPVTLGDALAAAGASSDILGSARRVELAIGNPSLETFPAGDLAALIARAAEIERSYGGSPFPQAQADIIRAYLRFLADGGSGAQFLSSFSAFSLDYLDLIRAGGLPGSFAAVSAGDIDAYLAYIDRTGALAQLAARDRVLAQAYLTFLRNGGNRDLFAVSFTDLTNAYFAFVRAGNPPAEFEGASAAVIGETIAFLAQSGLVEQLNAADRALVAAFLENGGLAFAGQFEAALGDYFAYLASGRLPSEYQTLDQATLRAYLETLSDTGLLATVLGDQAQFYADYLAFLRAGGEVDGFAGLPANIFAGYAVQLEAYRAFLDAGNLPSEFAAADAAQLQAFIAQLQAAGALDRFVGADAAFFAAFAQFVAGGGAFDAFAGLNANIFTGYAVELRAYFEFLEAGGLPSAYAPLSQDVIAQYLAALQAAGATGRFLPELSDFYAAYFAFVSGGGNPDNFAGLPVPPDFGAFAAALGAYAEFLAGGGLPADFAGQDLDLLASFLAALADAGQLEARLGANADLLSAYFAFLEAGGAPNAFTGLPVYADYVTALNAYFAFLADGGLPSDYSVLDQATINAYLAALQGAGGLTAFGDLDGFFLQYFAFVSGGGDPANFAGLPVYADYVAALNAYFAFLAGGGAPSDYTVLDQATIEAYLAALSGVSGGLTTFSNLNGFFAAFYDFIVGGGDPDQFAGLPINGGGNMGGGTGGGGTDGRLAEYLGGFANGAGLAYATFGGNSQDGVGAPILDDKGALVEAGRISNINADVVDIAGDALAVIGTYTNGDAMYLGARRSIGVNSGLPYVALAPITGDFPTSGTIDYEVLAATRPVFMDGAFGPGAFEGSLSLRFGAAPGYRTSGTITMPEASGSVAYNFASQGAEAGDFASISTFDTRFVILRGSVESDGRACATGNSCQIVFLGNFAGDDPAQRAGFVYDLFSSASQARIGGAVIYAPVGTNGGGDTGGPATGDYTGGFSADAANSVTAYAYSLSQAGFTIPVQARTPRFGGTNLGVTPNQHIIDENGGLARIQGSNGGTVIDRETALNVDIAGDANLLIGRWTDGRFVDGAGGPNGRNTLTANQGFHYFLARGLENPVSIAPGLVTYTLAHATQPTLGSGRSAPGVFNANLAIEYGAAPKLGIDGTIVFEGTSGFTYTFATNGGAAAPSKEISFSEPSAAGRGGFFSFTSDTGSTDTGLDGAFGATGSLGKADGSDLAIGYTVDLVPRTGFQGESIAGAAIFRSQDGAGGGGTGGSDTGTAVANQLVAYAGADVGIDMREKAEVTYNAAGAPVGYVWKLNDFTTENERPTIGTATAMEAGSRGDGLIGWARWADGQGGGRYYSDQDGFTLPANGGFHIVAVDPATDLPTGGQITYELAGATNPTVKDASLAPGDFAGTMAIAFGAAPTADFNFTVGIGGSSYNFGASGRPIETSGDFANQFGANGMTVSGTGSVCPTGACQANMRGALGGVGATAVGVSYNFAESGNENLRTYGAAAFVAPGINTSSSGSALTAASIAPGTAPIASIDMTRWGGSGTAGAQATAAALNLLPPGAIAPASRSANPALSREAAIRQAERLLGGAITFGRPGGAGGGNVLPE